MPDTIGLRLKGCNIVNLYLVRGRSWGASTNCSTPYMRRADPLFRKITIPIWFWGGGTGAFRVYDPGLGLVSLCYCGMMVFCGMVALWFYGTMAVWHYGFLFI